MSGPRAARASGVPAPDVGGGVPGGSGATSASGVPAPDVGTAALDDGTPSAVSLPEPAGNSPTSSHSRQQSSWLRKFLFDPRTIIGLVAALATVAFAFVGPAFASYSATEIVALPSHKPSAAPLLGPDVLGRDVLSILLSGGRGFMVEGFLAALVGVGVGGLIGMVVGLLSGRARTAVLFCNDTLMVVPQILIVLIVIAAFSANALTLTLAVAVAQVPYAARVVQAATRRVVQEDYYLAGRLAGQSRLSLMVHDILPNIAGPLLVEFGVRLCISFVVLASLSYLGFSAGAGDWGQMIHENQGGISIQPWAVLSPIICIAVFLVGMNLVRDRASNALSGK
ncbi:MAG: ABC transporter permease [Coriobacteriaceae bacterium]|jgi:peptide/nickel transport system permease protein|nr:ABC transporter permease [Coriobacteriaceae bacterium]